MFTLIAVPVLTSNDTFVDSGCLPIRYLHIPYIYLCCLIYNITSFTLIALTSIFVVSVVVTHLDCFLKPWIALPYTHLPQQGSCSWRHRGMGARLSTSLGHTCPVLFVCVGQFSRACIRLRVLCPSLLNSLRLRAVI